MAKRKDEIMRENEYGWDDEQLATAAADFCYNSHSNQRNAAASWVIERLVLPNTLDGYSAKTIKKHILEKLENV